MGRRKRDMLLLMEKERDRQRGSLEPWGVSKQEEQDILQREQERSDSFTPKAPGSFRIFA